MKKQDWRERLENSIRTHLELQIREAARHKEAYLSSNNPAVSQIWCAIANLSKQIFELSLKLRFLERGLQEIIEKQQKVATKKFKPQKQKKKAKAPRKKK